MKILIGDISSNKAITVVEFLKKAYPYIEIYSFDSRKFTKYIRTKNTDKHFIIAQDDIEAYINIIRKDKIDHFLPVINKSIKLIISQSVKFAHCLNYVGDYRIFEILNNKRKLMSLSSDLDIKIPKTYDDISDAKPLCVIKPTNLSSAEGVKYIRTDKEFQKALIQYKGKNDIIVQELVEGVGVGYSVYAKDGNILVGYGHKRLAEYPVSGGSSVYRETYDDKRMKDVASKVLRAVKWTGFAMFEFKLTADNELYFIEANPRIWGSINQGLQNGINYFEPILGKVRLQIDNQEKKTFFSPFIYGVLIKYAFNGNIKPLIKFIRNIRYNRADVFFFNDPKGWISLLLRKIL
jgi:carbamoylphosphate synthase large subunit